MNPTRQPDRRFPEGTILDERFELMKFIGSGSFGDVYLAQQTVFGHRFRKVALKLFKADCINVGNVESVLSDAIALISLLDDNPPQEVARRIVQVLDMGMIRKPVPRAYLCMQLISGGNNLEREVRRHRDGGMPVELSLYYLMQILIPLSWMHDNKIVHGDLKPDNVLIGPDNGIVLTDFGLAARIPIGVLGGAIAYQAPEVLRGQGGEQAADIYALGTMWYEMLTAQQPFASIGLEELGNKDASGYIKAQLAARKWPIRPGERNVPPEDEQRIPPASEINAELRDHPQLEAILNRCLAPRVSDRIASGGMLQREIKKYLETGVVSTPWFMPDRSSEQSSEPPRGGESRAPVEMNPHRSPQSLAADARMLLHEGQFERAKAVLDEVLARDADCVPAILARARLLAEQGSIEDAQREIKRAMNLARGDPEVFETMGWMYERDGKMALARQMRLRAEQLRKREKTRPVGRGQ